MQTDYAENREKLTLMDECFRALFSSPQVHSLIRGVLPLCPYWIERKGDILEHIFQRASPAALESLHDKVSRMINER